MRQDPLHNTAARVALAFALALLLASASCAAPALEQENHEHVSAQHQPSSSSSSSSSASSSSSRSQSALAIAEIAPVAQGEWSEEDVAFFVELQERMKDMTEEQLQGLTDDVVNRVVSTCNGWIDGMRNSLTSTVRQIRTDAESSINGIVTSLGTDVTAYVRANIVTPFSNFASRLEAAKTELQTVISAVTSTAHQVKTAIESAAITIGRRVANPLSIPDTVQCTPPSWLTGPNVTPDDLQSWCKLRWVSDRLGVAGFLDKVASLVTRHTSGLSSSASAFLEMSASASSGSGSGSMASTAEGADLGLNAQMALQLQAELSPTDCLRMRAAAVVLDGLDKSCNLLLSALDTESVTQFIILGVTAVFRVVSLGMKAACAAQGSF